MISLPEKNEIKSEANNQKIYEKNIGKIFSIVKFVNTDTSLSTKEIRICKRALFKRVEENNYINYYLFDKLVRHKSILDKFKHRYFKYFNNKHDDIYILKANSGEIYLTLVYILDVLLKKNNSKSPLLVATHKYHVDMINMICPDIPYVYIDNYWAQISDDSFIIDNFRFFLLYSYPHLSQVEKNIKSKTPGEYHYFYSKLNRFNIDEKELSMRKVILPAEYETSMLKKISQIGLNLDKFVFLAPEACSCERYDNDFWVVLINNLQAKGYDVFVNLTSDNIDFRGAKGYKTCFFTFGEAFALAKRSKKIVSLRSGFTEFLLQTNVPIDVLYTKFRRRYLLDDIDSYHIMAGFGITQLPFIDKSKITEFNMFEVSSKQCIDSICQGL